MQTTQAIVLRAVRYSDTRMVVSFFTEHYGLLSAMVRMSRGRSGGRSALWQQLTLVEMSVDYRSSANMQKVSDVAIRLPWRDLPYNPLKASVSMFLAEFLYRSLRGEGENRPLFSFLVNSLQWLDEAEAGIVNFHLLFMIRMTRFLGIWPGVDGYARNAVYDLQGACFSTVLPLHGHYVEAQDAMWIPLLLRMGYAGMRRLRIEQGRRRYMLEQLLLYYRLHVPAFGELQSLEVLKELFS
ncbi:MAG: DNA repair protein RecO [Bacteroidaceae bacterium]|nr:DNA repair protein RecO [Bacteroidaceae bacterium]